MSRCAAGCLTVRLICLFFCFWSHRVRLVRTGCHGGEGEATAIVVEPIGPGSFVFHLCLYHYLLKLFMHELMEEKNLMQFPFLPSEAHDMPPWNGTKTFSTSSQAVAQASLSIPPNAYPHKNSLRPMQVQDHSNTNSIQQAIIIAYIHTLQSRMLKANNYYHFFQISTRPASIAVVCVNRACQPAATRLSPPLQI